MKKLVVPIFAIVSISATSFAVSYINNRYSSAVVPAVNPAKEQSHPAPGNPLSSSTDSILPPVPSTLLLKVPFTPQAPTANWDKIHNENCEEVSAIMADEYYSGNTESRLDPAFVEQQLTKLTDWEMRTFGYNLDISSEEVVRMIESNFNLHAKVVTDFNENLIKQELSQDHLVLIPENGQLLGNPNYKRPGPKYHMLVARGYTHDKIVTNDPGTKNGMNYPYTFNTLYAANGNWDCKQEKVNLDKKNIIIVWK